MNTEIHDVAIPYGVTKKTYNDVLSALVKENHELKHQSAILASMPDLVVAFDNNGNIGFASQAAIDFFHIESGKHTEVRVSFWDVVTEESKTFIQKLFSDAVAEEGNSEEDFVLLNGGLPLKVAFLVQSKQGHYQEVQMASLKGTVHLQGDVHECICNIRLLLPTSSESSLSGEIEECKEENTEVFSKRARSNIQTTGEESNQGHSSKKIRAHEYFFHQVSDQDSNKWRQWRN